MASLMRSQALLRACPRAAFTPARPAFAPVSRPARGALVVSARAADPGAVKVKKALPSPEKRALISEERRVMNKSRKSACATRVKKVIKMAETLIAAPPKAEEEVKGLEKLMAEAYAEIDKAVVKGILHPNTGARKKARCARYKKQVLLVAGLYTPAPDSADYARFQKLQAKATAA
ncbi:30S ribosomal protein S20, chloroplastic [Tetrabaena socialis]|uniref:30S ribosomal protein S20, chloroplastic n=1 Tax=Tetrabaena socialis TaxID=47790 RepID=A0A2J7ZZS0_9CHLO|nr:30S ribosomal protein S20, chloroplastic [Tetrabaena socialis]|eukprot:PNH05762.1 30S ribosomal protein S20, chloroplastic [Tetrabaena socialis]